MDELQIKTKVIGVDITLEYTTCAVVDIRGTIIGKERFATSDYPNVNNYVTVLCEKIVTLAENNGGYESIRSVGISAPSSNFKTGCIENRGKASFHWPPCCATGWEWQWPWATTATSPHSASLLTAVRTACRTSSS